MAKRRPPQLELFTPRTLGIEPDAVVRARALAEALPPHVRLGTSSWTFPGWKGLVFHEEYESQRAFVQRSLAEYARFPLFRTVGIDRSYYGPIPAHELAAMRAQLPSDFRAVMKVWDGITALQFADRAELGARRRQENPSFLDPDAFARHVDDAVREAFDDRLGAYVVEIPPTPDRPDEARFLAALERFLSRVRTPERMAIEVRDARLIGPRYRDLLAAAGASHVYVFWTRMPSLARQRALVPFGRARHVVVRLMLPHARGYEQRRAELAPFDRLVDPQPAMRDDVVRIATEAGDLGLPTFIIANNKAEGSAPLTLMALAERLAAVRT